MKLFNITTVLLCTIFTISCKKDKTLSDENVTIYVAGNQRDSATGADRAGYWKDGTFTANTLATSSAYNNYAHAIAVNGTDVYTTGFEIRPGRWQCLVWKNGAFQYSLGTVYGEGNAISVVGADVYVGGLLYENPDYFATSWKNETPTILGTVSTMTSQVLGSTVSGTDVYMVGNVGNIGKVWKNGIDMNLANATGTTPKAIAVSGTDVYAAGNLGSTTIRYWKNNNYTDITAPAGRQIYASGIAVENNDVYVCGWEYNGTVGIAKYWKNGTEVVLGDGVRNSRANGIAVKNNDVYVAGDESGSVGLVEYATLWKNGIRNTMGTRGSRAMAIALK